MTNEFPCKSEYEILKEQDFDTLFPRKEEIEDATNELLFGCKEEFSSCKEESEEVINENLFSCEEEFSEILKDDEENPKRRHSVRWDSNNKQLSEMTKKGVSSAASVLSAPLYGRHLYFNSSFVMQKDFYNIWNTCSPITSVCTSIDDLDKDKGADKEKTDAFLDELKSYMTEILPKLGHKNTSGLSIFTLFKILIPHDLPEETILNFIKGFLELTNYQNGVPFIVTTMNQGNGRYLMLFICDREYYRDIKEIPVQIAKKDQFYDKTNGRSCTKDNPNAVLRCKAGTVIRSIKTHFGMKIPNRINYKEFQKMRDSILDYMNNYFTEQGCSVDNKVLLGRYDGTALNSFGPKVRHWCKRYNSAFQALENDLTSLYYAFLNNYQVLQCMQIKVQIMRHMQTNVYVPEPGDRPFISGYDTLTFSGRSSEIKKNFDLLITKIAVQMDDILNCIALNYTS